jgi:undecaprenyl-diphosphatase
VVWTQVVVLAVLQGLTEFLPISSSAHLIVLPLLVDWPDQGLAFDVAVHVGTLLAVLAYFRRDLRRMGGDWLRSLAARGRVGDSAMVWFLLVGTVPVGVCGLVLSAVGTGFLRNASVIAGATILFALLLWWSDRYGRGTRRDSEIGWRLPSVSRARPPRAFPFFCRYP